MSIPNHCAFCSSENIAFFGNAYTVKDSEGEYFVLEEYLCSDCGKTFFIN